jgi:hypothetical protein
MQTDLFQSAFFILYLETLMSTPALFESSPEELQKLIKELEANS